MSTKDILSEIKNAIKFYPDFPKEGVIFRDFFPVLQSPRLFDGVLTLYQEYLNENVKELHYIAGVESRGFLLGPSLALKLNLPFIPIRKPGKLPGEVKKELYTLEYGSDALEVQTNAIKKGEKVVIIDDLIATGGSLEASVRLVKSIGGIVPQCLVAMELIELNGRSKVGAPVHSLLQF